MRCPARLHREQSNRKRIRCIFKPVDEGKFEDTRYFYLPHLRRSVYLTEPMVTSDSYLSAAVEEWASLSKAPTLNGCFALYLAP